MTNVEFLDITNAVSCPETAHTCHMMNWPQRVFGTFLYDYRNNAELAYNNMWIKMEPEFL